jgi:predicted RNase H-like nuclease (RuvC/YqgF family)
MAGKLDEISEAIGRLRASVADIQRRMEDNRRLQDERYAHSSTALRSLAQKLDKHAASVEMIRPTVAALELSRSKLTTWASIGLAAVVLVGWVVEAAVKWAAGAVFSHFH